MSVQVGDSLHYIHLHTARYRNSKGKGIGIAQNGKEQGAVAWGQWDMSNSPTGAIKSLQNQHKAMINNTALKDFNTIKDALEASLNFFMSGKEPEDNLQKQNLELMKDALQGNNKKKYLDTFRNIVQSSLKTGNIDTIQWDKGTLNLTDIPIPNYQKIEYVSKAEQYTMVKTIRERIELLDKNLEAINNVVQSMVKDSEEQKQLQDQYNQFQRHVENIRSLWMQLQNDANIVRGQKFYAAQSETDTQHYFINPITYQIGNKTMIVQDRNSFINYLNYIIQTYSFNASAGYAMGQLGELLVDVQPYLLLGLAAEKIQKYVTDAVTGKFLSSGSNVVRRNIKFENFLIDKKQLQGGLKGIKQVELNDGTTGYYYAETAQKIDVEWDYSPLLKQTQSQNATIQKLINTLRSAKISVKNYSSSSNLSIVTGTNLLYVMQDMDANFLAHWINMITLTNDFKDSKEQQEEEESFYSQELRRRRELAFKLAKASIFAKTLTGSVVGDSMANIFVVNRGKGFRVYSMSDILSTLFNNVDNIDKYMNLQLTLADRYVEGEPEKQQVDDFIIYQKTHSSASVRMNNILARLYAAKLHAAVRPALLTDSSI